MRHFPELQRQAETRKRSQTHPPLNAPTGFRTGNGVTSANLRADVVKPRTAVGVDNVRIAAGRTRAAIVGYGDLKLSGQTSLRLKVLDNEVISSCDSYLRWAMKVL